MIKKGILLDYNLTFFQEDNGFKFNLDSILLAEYVNIKNNNTILDMCSGNAVIPLVLLSKNDSLKIDCVEIQEEVCKVANKNVEINGFSDKINVIRDNLINIKKRNYYDIITCNPPYFKSNNKKGNNKSKNISKYELYTDIEEIVKFSKKYLNPKGKLYLIYRVERIAELINILKNNNFGILNITFIITKNNHSKLFLIESQKSKKDNTNINFIYTEKLNSYKNIFD